MISSYNQDRNTTNSLLPTNMVHDKAIRWQISSRFLAVSQVCKSVSHLRKGCVDVQDYQKKRMAKAGHTPQAHTDPDILMGVVEARPRSHLEARSNHRERARSKAERINKAC